VNKTLIIGTTTAAAIAIGVSVLSFSSAEETAGLLPYQNADRVAHGKELYADYCASCHGVNLEGQPNWQSPDANGLLPAPPHDPSGHTWHHDDALLIRIVTEGTEAVVGGGYQSAMMGFSDVMTDADILDVLAYIKSTWPDEVKRIHNDINARMASNG